jgi:hypothetical protein
MARDDVLDHQRESQEPRSSPLKGWHVAALVLIFSMLVFGVGIYVVVAMLSQ